MRRDNLRLAKVMRIQPGGHAVDILFLDDGSRVPGVQVMSPTATANSGLADLSGPDTEDEEEGYDPLQNEARASYALVGYLMNYPVVLGFLFPQVCEMLFADMNRRINRHGSDVYSSLDKDGNLEVYHPSGTFFRVGVTAAHEDLTGKDLDQKWKIAKNLDKAVHVQLTVKNQAHGEVANLNIAPTGTITLSHAGDLITTTQGNAAIHVVGNAALTVDGAATWTIGETWTVDSGAITFNAPSVTFNVD